LTGKKTRQYDESLTAIEQMQQAGTAVQQIDVGIDFACRNVSARGLGSGSNAPF
jgi:hypothetical protein